MSTEERIQRSLDHWAIAARVVIWLCFALTVFAVVWAHQHPIPAPKRAPVQEER
jgi:hypothetical protein